MSTEMYHGFDPDHPFDAVGAGFLRVNRLRAEDQRLLLRRFPPGSAAAGPRRIAARRIRLFRLFVEGSRPSDRRGGRASSAIPAASPSLRLRGYTPVVPGFPPPSG